MRVLRSFSLQLLLVLCLAFLCRCSQSSLPPDVSGKILVRLDYEDFCLLLKEGEATFIRQPTPIFLRSYDSSSNPSHYIRNSVDDAYKIFAYNDDTSHLYVFDLSLDEKKLIYDSQPDHLYYNPIVSPDGHYVAFVTQSGGTSMQPGAYTIVVINLLNGGTQRLPLENHLAGNNLIVPGMIRWLNDSSGFTYHRTRSEDGDLKTEICTYNIENNSTNIIASGIGGLPSPRNDKLLWMKPGDTKTLYAMHMGSGKTYEFACRRKIIDYTWSPDGENVAVMIDGLMSGKVVVVDDELHLRHTIDTGRQMRMWDIYFVPMRWLPLDSEAVSE